MEHEEIKQFLLKKGYKIENINEEVKDMDYLFGYKISDSKYPQMKIIETPKFILRPATLKGAP